MTAHIRLVVERTADGWRYEVTIDGRVYDATTDYDSRDEALADGVEALAAAETEEL